MPVELLCSKQDTRATERLPLGAGPRTFSRSPSVLIEGCLIKAVIVNLSFDSIDGLLNYCTMNGQLKQLSVALKPSPKNVTSRSEVRDLSPDLCILVQLIQKLANFFCCHLRTSFNGDGRLG